MTRLKTLKPLMQAVPSRQLRALDATQRQRGRAWMDRRAEWFRRNPLCVACDVVGRVSLATQLDHIVPLIDGGSDDDGNLQGLCEDCHKTKTAGEASRRARGG